MQITILDKIEIVGDTAKYAMLLSECSMEGINKEILIFGAGLYGTYAKTLFENKYPFSVVNFVDNDKIKIGKIVSGVSIISPKAIRDNPTKYFIIIAASTDMSAFAQPSKTEIICIQLLNYGVASNDIAFFVSEHSADFDLFDFFPHKLSDIYINSLVQSYTTNFKLSQLKLFNFLSWFKYCYNWMTILEWIYKNAIHSFKKNIKFLEIGPGIGTMSIMLKTMLDCDITWLNIKECEHENLVKNTKHIEDTYGISMEYGNIETVSAEYFDNNKFDYIILTEVLEHFNYNPKPTLEKIKAWLRPGGKVCITTPNNKKALGIRYYDSWKDMPVFLKGGGTLPYGFDYLHHFEYTSDEVIELFKAAGLSVRWFASSVNGDNLNFVFQV